MEEKSEKEAHGEISRIYGGERTSSKPLKEWKDEDYRQDRAGGGRDGAAAERCGLIEIILTSSSNLCRGNMLFIYECEAT